MPTSTLRLFVALVPAALGACNSAAPKASPAPMTPSAFVLREREVERDQQRNDIRTPGSEHRIFDTLVGDFRATVRYWPKAEGPALESSAMATNSWILGGRFLSSELRGELNGKPWERRSIYGYDRARKAYVQVSVDSSTTEMQNQAQGQWKEDSQEILFQRSHEDVVVGELVHLRESLHVSDWRTHRWELWMDPANGLAHRVFEIHYERIR